MEKIIIDHEKSDGDITINVKDFGTTIQENLREKVFSRSFQMKKTKKDRGLGLSIVKKIAATHRARVGVKANKPQGNIFYPEIKKNPGLCPWMNSILIPVSGCRPDNWSDGFNNETDE